MSDRRLLVTGVAGVALIGAIAVVAVLVVGRDRGPESGAAPPGPGADAAAAEAASTSRMASAPGTWTGAGPEGTSPASGGPPGGEASGGAGRDPWEEVDAVLKPGALGPPLAGALVAALEEMRDQVEPCFEEERLHPVEERPSAPITGPAVLVLRLEPVSVPGAAGSAPPRLAVVGIEVETLGHSSRRLVACARAILRAYEFAAPGAAPGRRYRVKMLLQ